MQGSRRASERENKERERERERGPNLSDNPPNSLLRANANFIARLRPNEPSRASRNVLLAYANHGECGGTSFVAVLRPRWEVREFNGMSAVNFQSSRSEFPR